MFEKIDLRDDVMDDRCEITSGRANPTSHEPFLDAILQAEAPRGPIVERVFVAMVVVSHVGWLASKLLVFTA